MRYKNIREKKEFNNRKATQKEILKEVLREKEERNVGKERGREREREQKREKQYLYTQKTTYVCLFQPHRKEEKNNKGQKI